MTIDLTEVYKKHQGKWVAMKEEEAAVIASGESVSEVIRKSKKKGFSKPVVFKVPKENIPYIGSYET